MLILHSPPNQNWTFQFRILSIRRKHEFLYNLDVRKSFLIMTQNSVAVKEIDKSIV